MMSRSGFILALAAAALISSAAQAEKRYDPGVSDTGIKIGQTVPLSGPVSAYGTFSRASLAYFAMINDHGGVGGRKIDLLSVDDGFSPPRTVEQTRKLVEGDGVFLIFAPVGTAPSIAAQKYLNAKKVPQLFLQSGISRWNDPQHFPWSMSGLPNYDTEAHRYAGYILAHKPGARIAVLYQNDDFGKEYLRGLKQGLGDAAGKMIVDAESFELTDPTVDSQVITLAGSGADTFLVAATSKQTAQALKRAHDIGWRPLTIVSFVSASIDRTFVPAGIETAVGVVSATVFKDPHDPAFRDSPDVQAYTAWMDRYYPEGDKNDGLNVAAYVEGQLFVEILKQCGDELTRENVMTHAAHLDRVSVGMLWPGITVSSSPEDYNLFNELQLIRFDGKYLRPLGDAAGK